MKSIYDLSEELWMKSLSNNWLKLHGYAMIKNSKQRNKPKKRKNKPEELPFK